MANLPCEHIAGGGGYADEQERLLTFLLLFLFIIIYSSLTPSSFIPRSLDLHRQVDMQAEEVEEHVGVDLSVGVAGKINYEEPGSGSAADFSGCGNRVERARDCAGAPHQAVVFTCVERARDCASAPHQAVIFA